MKSINLRGGSRIRGALLVVVVLAVASAIGAWKGSSQPPARLGSSICGEPSLTGIRSPGIGGHVRQLGTYIRLLSVHRDASTTIAKMCVQGLGMPARAPYALDGKRALRPGGMLLARRGDAISATLVYPPSAGKTVTFMLPKSTGANPIGSAEFAPVPTDACPLRAAPPFSVLACGSVLYLRWQPPWRVAPNRVGIVDVRPSVRTSHGWKRLEFYLYGVSRSRGGDTQIDFAIPRTAAARIRLDVHEVDLVHPNLVFHPKQRTYDVQLSQR